MAEVLRGRAPAKVNLVLEVTGRRDDGYHEIDTILQELELADEVAVTPKGARGINVDGQYAAGTPADETNLAWRAAALLAEALDRSSNVHIHLTKRIPPGGGLGGGSSDAATVLRLLGKAWSAPTETVSEIAAQVGSDVPFFLAGGTARASGRGERVSALPPLSRHGVVLFIPETTIPQKTATLFAALDHLPFDPGGLAESFGQRERRSFVSADVFNAFERVAFDVFEGLRELRDELQRRSGLPVRLAGAGPTLFWIGNRADSQAMASAGSELPCTVVVTDTAPRG